MLIVIIIISGLLVDSPTYSHVLSCCRNVLVATEAPLTIKLSDVGLARTLKSSNYYKKTSDDKVLSRNANYYFLSAGVELTNYCRSL
jgi:hypothetical protein